VTKIEKIIEAAWYITPPKSLALKILIAPVVLIGCIALYVKEIFFPRPTDRLCGIRKGGGPRESRRVCAPP